MAAIDAIQIADPYTIRLVTKAPFAPLVNYLTNTRTATQIVSRTALKAMGDEAFGRRPVGTGPYIIKDWKSGESLELVAFPGAFSGAPKIARVLCPLIAEESSGMTAILGNQLDLTSTAPFADIGSLEKRPEVKVLKQAGLNTRYIALNNKKGPFSDIHFRRAVSMAFDREVLVKAVLFGEGVAIPGVLPPALWADPKPVFGEYVTYNPERARAELAKSAYKAGTEATMLVWGSNWWHRMGEIVAGQANQILGTKITLQATDFNTAYSRAKAGDYDAMVMGWLGFVDPDEYHRRNSRFQGLSQHPFLFEPEDGRLARAWPRRDRSGEAQGGLSRGGSARRRRAARAAVLLLEHSQSAAAEREGFRATALFELRRPVRGDGAGLSR